MFYKILLSFFIAAFVAACSTTPKDTSKASGSGTSTAADPSSGDQDILDDLNKYANDSLNKSNDDSIRDGMDITLCSINFEEMKNIASSAEIQNQYETNSQEAINSDVFGAPSYVYNGEVFWGQDRLDYLEDALKNK